MGNFIKVFLVLFSMSVYSQNHLISVSVDPSASFKEKNLDVLLEYEYSKSLYYKVGYEYFSLEPKYSDVHIGFGKVIKLDSEDKYKSYIGIRGGVVFRDKHNSPLYGLETGLDYQVINKVYLGLRGTLDYRTEGRNLGWDDFIRGSGFVRLTYKLN